MSDRRRLPTAFALWWQANKDSVQKDGKNTIKEASKIWRSLADEEKQTYKDMVDEKKNDRDMEVIEVCRSKEKSRTFEWQTEEVGTVVHCGEEVRESELTVYSESGCSPEAWHNDRTEHVNVIFDLYRFEPHSIHPCLDAVCTDKLQVLQSSFAH